MKDVSDFCYDRYMISLFVFYWSTTLHSWFALCTLQSCCFEGAKALGQFAIYFLPLYNMLLDFIFSPVVVSGLCFNLQLSSMFGCYLVLPKFYCTSTVLFGLICPCSNILWAKIISLANMDLATVQYLFMLLFWSQNSFRFCKYGLHKEGSIIVQATASRSSSIYIHLGDCGLLPLVCYHSGQIYALFPVQLWLFCFSKSLCGSRFLLSFGIRLVVAGFGLDFFCIICVLIDLFYLQ